MKRQLALNVALSDSASFANFLRAPNHEAVDRLQRNLAALETGGSALDPVIFIAGTKGTGKSHLLQATCMAARVRDGQVFYVTLSDHAVLAPSLLDLVGPPRVVCLDDVDAIAGEAAWERAVLTLWERMRSVGGMLVAGARAVPGRIPYGLADLASRLGAGPVYSLAPLNDAEKHEAIRLRAANRGFALADDVVHYIINRYPRDLHSLFGLLDRLDAQSLASQRRITIPFLRELERD